MAIKNKIKNKKTEIKKRKPVTLYNIIRRQAALKFNYPSVKLVSDGDIVTFLKSIVL
jgi:hypothetical protein